MASWQVRSVADGTIAKGNDDWQLAEMVATTLAELIPFGLNKLVSALEL